jgi:hypothetical protein
VIEAGAGDAGCPHTTRDDRSVCIACGHCVHDVILNGACLYCGATDLPPITHKDPPDLVPPDRLKRRHP